MNSKCKIKKKFAIVFIVIISLLIGSCSGNTPKCSKESTVLTLKRLLIENYKGDSANFTENDIQYMLNKIKVELPVPESYDDKIKKYSCNAKIVLQGERQYEFPIKYTSQLDDNKQHIVSARLEFRLDSMVTSLAEDLKASITNNNLEESARLINKGADVNAVVYREPMLLTAIKSKNKDMVEFLIAKGADVNAGEGYLLREAMNIRDKNIVKLLINKGADVNTNNGALLKWAVDGHEKDIVKLLIDKGADVNADNGAPLKTAIMNDDKNMAALLISKGADVNVDNGAPLKLAVTRNYKDMVEFLRQYDASQN